MSTEYTVSLPPPHHAWPVEGDDLGNLNTDENGCTTGS
jgi:hypothetical protein